MPLLYFVEPLVAVTLICDYTSYLRYIGRRALVVAALTLQHCGTHNRRVIVTRRRTRLVGFTASCQLPTREHDNGFGARRGWNGARQRMSG